MPGHGSPPPPDRGRHAGRRVHMSTEQYDSLASKINDPDIGGFTADVTRGGKSPKSVYMVGQRDVKEGEHALPSSGASIRSYVEENEHVVTQPGRKLGGWSANSGNLDVPKSFPRTPQGEVEARRSTVTNTQQAYGEINSRGNYVGDTNNPFHDARERQGGKETGFSAPKEPEQHEAWAGMALHSAQFKGTKKGRSRSPAPGHASESFS